MIRSTHYSVENLIPILQPTRKVCGKVTIRRQVGKWTFNTVVRHLWASLWGELLLSMILFSVIMVKAKGVLPDSNDS